MSWVRVTVAESLLLKGMGAIVLFWSLVIVQMKANVSVCISLSLSLGVVCGSVMSEPLLPHLERMFYTLPQFLAHSMQCGYDKCDCLIAYSLYLKLKRKG